MAAGKSSPARPARLEGLEDQPLRFEVMDADPEAVKAFIARHGAD